MRCLSVRQPWADLIVRGVKDVENRGWQCRVRGPLLIHASLTLEKIARMELEKRGHRFGYLPLGCIVGAARIVDCLPGRLAKSDWHEEDAWGIYLADAVKFEEPIKYAGKLQFFDVPLLLVGEQLRKCGLNLEEINCGR